MENHRIKSLKSPRLFHSEVLSLPRITEQNLQLRSLLINSSKKQRDTKWTRLQQKAANGQAGLRAEPGGHGRLLGQPSPPLHTIAPGSASSSPNCSARLDTACVTLSTVMVSL